MRIAEVILNIADFGFRRRQIEVGFFELLLKFCNVGSELLERFSFSGNIAVFRYNRFFKLFEALGQFNAVAPDSGDFFLHIGNARIRVFKALGFVKQIVFQFAQRRFLPRKFTAQKAQLVFTRLNLSFHLRLINAQVFERYAVLFHFKSKVGILRF